MLGSFTVGTIIIILSHAALLAWGSKVSTRGKFCLEGHLKDFKHIMNPKSPHYALWVSVPVQKIHTLFDKNHLPPHLD